MPDQDGVLAEGEFDPEHHDPDFDLVDVPQSPEALAQAQQNQRLIDRLIKNGELRQM